MACRATLPPPLTSHSSLETEPLWSQSMTIAFPVAFSSQCTSSEGADLRWPRLVYIQSMLTSASHEPAICIIAAVVMVTIIVW